MEKLKATILRIEKTSIYDGPGLRTVIFFKGCPLNCKWCSTVESQSFDIEIGHIKTRCIKCGRCIELCKEAALSLENGKIVRDKSICNHSFVCVNRCIQSSFKKYGQKMTVQEVFEEITKDEVFFFHSNGGVTLSGGEPLCYSNFAKELLKESKNIGINTAIETSFFVDYKDIEKILPYIDIIYVDLKHMSKHKHKILTGVENDLILENIKKVDKATLNFKLRVRVPLIPSINDDEENLLETIKFCEELEKLEYIEILPYHRLGVDTYEYLGLEYELKNYKSQNITQMKEIEKFMKSNSKKVKIVI